MKMTSLAAATLAAVLALGAAPAAEAAGDRDGRGHHGHHGHHGWNDRGHDRGRGHDRRDDRRHNHHAPHRVVHRKGPPHGWARGHDYRRSYRGPVYVINDYSRYDLRRPPRGHHWIRDDRGNMLLVAVATGIIADLLLHH